MSIFGNLFKAQPDRRESDAPKNPLGVWKGSERTLVTYHETISAQQALKHPVVFRCINKIAESVQTVHWYAEADPYVVDTERAKARDIKAMNDLLASPHDTLSPDQLRYWMAMNFACYGRVPFKVGVGVEGRPNGIYPLATRFVSSIEGSNGAPIAYRYGMTEDGKISNTLPTRKKAGPKAAYAYEIYRPNLDGFLGTNCGNVNTLQAIGLPSQVIKLLLQRAADTASGHPNTRYIITSEKTLTVDQKKAVQDYLENAEPNGEESGHILFLYNTDVKVHKLDNDLSDIHSKMPLDDMARQICGAFGIPVALVGLGAADGAKFASNYVESRRSFWEDTIIPGYLSPFATGLTQALCPYGMRICFDYDTISALSDVRIANAKALSDVTFLTKNEKREMTGFEPATDGTGDEYDAKPAAVTPPVAPPTEDDQ